MVTMQETAITIDAHGIALCTSPADALIALAERLEGDRRLIGPALAYGQDAITGAPVVSLIAHVLADDQRTAAGIARDALLDALEGIADGHAHLHAHAAPAAA